MIEPEGVKHVIEPRAYPPPSPPSNSSIRHFPPTVIPPLTLNLVNLRGPTKRRSARDLDNGKRKICEPAAAP